MQRFPQTKNVADLRRENHHCCAGSKSTDHLIRKINRKETQMQNTHQDL